jgi:hypothetical protein
LEQDVEVIANYEGLSIQEAVLTYAERKKMPQKSFCGPNRTYPSHDAKHVSNAFARLSQFGHRLPTEVRKKIYKCLVRRAKRYGVKHDPKKYKWGKYVTETAYDPDAIVEWFLDNIQK